MAAKLKTYHCSFPGLYVGGEAVVRATSADDARQQIIEAAPMYGLGDLNPELISVEPVPSPRGIYFFTNGDY